MATEPKKFESLMLEAIKFAIKESVELEFDKKIKELNDRKNEICGGVIMRVVGSMSVDSFQEKIVIDLKEIKNTK